MPRSPVLFRTNCSMARIRTSDRAASRGGAVLVAVPPWQNRARPRTSPTARWLSSDGTAGGCVMQLFSTLFAGPGGRSGPSYAGSPSDGPSSVAAATAAERGAGPVAHVAGPEEGTTDAARAVAPFEAAPHAPEQARAERDEDGQDQP